jgi:hypothetical protein
MLKILCLGLEHFFCKVFIIKQLYSILYYTRELDYICTMLNGLLMLLLRKDAVIVKNPREKVLFFMNVVKEI